MVYCLIVEYCNWNETSRKSLWSKEKQSCETTLRIIATTTETDANLGHGLIGSSLLQLIDYLIKKS
jgi:hypothetical protein